MTTYVLVPGFWLGAWAWRPVTEALRERGHTVYPLSLTGMAERVDEARPDTNLETHIDDVLNLLISEDLHDVVLVGHSYAGLVITAAADRLTERIAQLVYVDSGPLPDGMAQTDFSPPEQRAADADLVAKSGDGWRLPPPPWAALAAEVPDVDDAAIEALTTKAVPQPWATATTPVRLTGAWEKLPRYAILSTFTAENVRELAAVVPTFRHMAGDEWQYRELSTWHWPMFSRPIELAEILDGVGSPPPPQPGPLPVGG
jgi:pimeloyl-ACP methyl ester carboxylesterase